MAFFNSEREYAAALYMLALLSRDVQSQFLVPLV